MDTLVFITSDITPEPWNDFKEAGAFEGASPYILVSSLSQTDFKITPPLTSPVKCSFPSTTIESLKSAYATLLPPELNNIETTFFIILSPSDRHATFISAKPKWYRDDGSESSDTTGTKWRVWSKYRCKYEDTYMVTSSLQCFDGGEPAEEAFVEELGRELWGEEEDEESEEELEETDSEDEDWEYGDHPLGKGERVKGA